MQCMELHLEIDKELTESVHVYVRIPRREGRGDIIVLVCYKPPDQEDQAEEVFYKHKEAASHS